jgi:L-ascorbate metabolism protein UlaG (beta-lactamase superfamily)
MGEGIRITMTRAEHSSEYRWTNPETQQPEIHVGGEPAGFIIELENGLKIYHMGDTGLLGDLGFNASYFRPDLVLIPIGGHFTMDPKDAALTTREHLKPRYAIPVHYGTKCPTQGQPRGVPAGARRDPNASAEPQSQGDLALLKGRVPYGHLNRPGASISQGERRLGNL